MATPIMRVKGQRIRPLLNYVAVKVSEVPETAGEAGLIIRPDINRDRTQYAEAVGVITAVGPVACRDYGVPPHQVGDTVVFNSYTGIPLFFNGELYRLMHDRDAVAVIDPLPGDAQVLEVD
jgi:co-chaperonin GroES (HSP10)